MFTTAPALAQNNDYSFTIELQGPDRPLTAAYSIQLLDVGNRNIIATAFGNTAGDFSFRGVPRGDYLARVVDGGGYVVREEMVIVDGLSPSIQLGALESRHTLAGTGTVSVRQLLKPPAKPAIKAFMESQKYSKAERYQDAAIALERAIKLSPEFAEAHTNLAAQYLRLSQFEKAREQATLGMDIAGPNIRDLTNLAIAEWALGRTTQALQFAQAALRLDQRALGAHYIVGSLLVSSPNTLREGMHHLELAAEKLSSAAQKLAACREALARNAITH